MDWNRKLLSGLLLVTVTLLAACSNEFQCASFPDGTYEEVKVSQGKIKNLDFLKNLNFEDNIAHVKCDDGTLHFVSSQGNILQAFQYDNGPDYFSEGLARIIDGKTGLLGYTNNQLDIVILPKFQTASSFKEGLALVSTKSEEGNSLWGIIDNHGEPHVELKYGTKKAAISQIDAK
jgi:hypothetical protein